MNTKRILEELIIDITNNVDVPRFTDKLQVFSRLLGNEKFSNWINHEFVYGYNEDEQIPSYRQIRAVNLIASYSNGKMKITRVPIPIINKGIDVYERTMLLDLRDTIKSISQAIELSSGNITYSVLPNTQCLIQQIIGPALITESYFEFSRQSFQKVIDTCKAKLIDVLLDLNENLFNGEIDFERMDKQERQLIINNIYAANVHMGSGNIEANKSNNIGGNNNTCHMTPDLKSEIQDVIGRIEKMEIDDEADKNDIAKEIFVIKEELKKQDSSPTVIKRALRILKSIGRIAQEKLIELGIDQIIASLPM